MNSSPSLIPSGDSSVRPLEFVPVSAYTTFFAEYAILGEDIVFHFFRAPDAPERFRSLAFWTESFPEVLAATAKQVFRSDYPQLQAEHVCDFGIDSWWLRAFGLAHIPDPRALVHRFFDALDSALEAKSKET